MIGIFDSGIGGLTVASAFREKLQGYDIVYFGDTARTPYGTKSPETVISYSLQNAEFLISQGAKIIVIACNTASSIAAGAIVNKFDIPLRGQLSKAIFMNKKSYRPIQMPGCIQWRAPCSFLWLRKGGLSGLKPE